MTQPGHQQGNIPTSYEGTPPVQNFAAPSHHLSTEQSKEVVALAEASHKDTQGGFMGQNTGSSGLTGSHGSSGFGSSATDNIASTLGGGTGSATRSHGVTGGEYERTGNDLTGNRTSLTSGSGAGLGSSTHDSSSHSHGLGAGAAGVGAGAAGAGVYGSNIGSHGDSSARGGASAVSAKQSGKGGELTDHEFRNTAPSGTLENKLQDELERNARKAGTHASGFGVQGTPAGSASLGSGTTSGLTGHNTTGAGYAAPGQQYSTAQTGTTGLGSGHHSSAAPLAGAAGVGAVGTGAAGYGVTHGQQGLSAHPEQAGTGGHLADQIHGLGTERPLHAAEGHFGSMQDHKRSNEEAAHLPGTEGRRV